MMTPLYKHDCPQCVFIATAAVLDRAIDVYHSHPNHEGDRWGYIVRYSDEPSDYQTVYPAHCTYTRLADQRLVLQADFALCQTIERLTA